MRRILRTVSNVAIGTSALLLVAFGFVPHAIGMLGGSGAGMVAYGLMVLGGLYAMPIAAGLLCAGLAGRLLSRRCAP